MLEVWPGVQRDDLGPVGGVLVGNGGRSMIAVGCRAVVAASGHSAFPLAGNAGPGAPGWCVLIGTAELSQKT